ncbi:MAG: hypothetical protein KAR42_07550 [candidate division Zixibacteria bacterium]|nr:hypothetical protein [candidate division Zixibacteria bacterium]
MELNSIGAWLCISLAVLFILIPIPFIIRGRKKREVVEDSGEYNAP